MSTVVLPKKYADPSYQAAHEGVYSHPLGNALESVLPPGITRDVFDEALKECASVLSEHSAVYTGGNLKDYVDPYELPEDGYKERVPGAAICLSSIEELKAVLKIFNSSNIPVWVVSRGKNLGYGGAAPVVPGSVILDLHRINKIIEVNDKLAYAVVEPGVTFTDLYNHIARHKLKVWPSTASLGWGSVIGNTLDRGMGFIPMGMHHQHIAGLEVVLANGDTVRTGQFASTASPSAHTTALSFGPTIDGLFLQSNLGIVTKMGIRMQPQPEAYMSCRLDMPNFEDLTTIIDVFGELRRSGVTPFVYVYPICMEAALYKPRHEWYADMAVPIPEWRLGEIMNELGCGYWTVRFSLLGPLAVVRAHYDEVGRRVAARAPTGRLSCETFTGRGDGGLVDAAAVPMPHGGQFVGVPDIEGLAVTKVANKPAKADAPGGHAAYSPILPLDGKVIMDWVRASKNICARHGYDLLEDFYFDDRCAISVCEVPWEKTDGEQRARVARIIKELVDEGSRRGLTPYRAHIKHMGKYADLFDFNDQAYRRFVETVKDTLDPNGILSPGKQGIWPRRLRHLSKRKGAKL